MLSKLRSPATVKAVPRIPALPAPGLSPLERFSRSICAIALLLMCVASVAAAQPVALPETPAGSRLLFVHADHTMTDGQGWLVQTRFGRESFHLDGPSALAIDLTELKLEPGSYRLGLILRTGTRWTGPVEHIPAYRLALQDPTGSTTDLGTPRRLVREVYHPRMESGEEGSWANWFGTVQAETPVRLQGTERLVIEHREGHGGVVALWVLPVQGIAATTMRLRTLADGNVWIAGQTPTVSVTLSLPQDAPAVDGMLHLDRIDLLTGKKDRQSMPVALVPGETRSYSQPYPADAGVFRVIAGLPAQAEGDHGLTAEGVLYACAPARLARDLPNDWPLGTHVNRDIPPLPGFKWYRYFSGWHRINPAPGAFHWDEFDDIFRQVQTVGGKLFIADDGAPVWTSQRGKAGMPWAEGATAYPPDDWETLGTYLRTMIARYEDAAGTLGALELCNEANTAERWLGSAEDLVQMAQVFREAIATAKHPITLVGIAVSAGHQQDFVESVVDAGILDHVDQVSGHWYEELMSFERETPINSLPRHVDLLADPMQRLGKVLPIINSECGIEFIGRDGDRLVSQAELNRLAEADPSFDSAFPWLSRERWRPVSERRAAATFVTGTAMLMALGVRQSFSYSHQEFILDGAPSLPWVALACFGRQLEGVDYQTVRAVPAHVVGSDGKDGSPLALAYEFGKPDGKRFIIAWSFLSDTSVGRSKHWQRWLDPIEIAISSDLTQATYTDLYGRSVATAQHRDGNLYVLAGEEPIFIAHP